MGGFGGGLTGERATLGGMMGGGAAVPGLGGPGMPVAAGSVPTGGLLLLSGPRAFERVGDEWRQRGYAGQDAPLLPRDSQEFAGLASRFPDLLPLTLQPDAVVFIVDDAWLRLAPAPKPESKPE